jgi:hypothetical protein
MWSLRRGLPMATDQEPITQTVQDYFGGWYDADAVPMGQALPYRGYLHPIRTGDGWKIADASWLPR